MESQSKNPTTIRLSLGLICMGILIFFAIGLSGGYIGSRFTPQRITVLPNGDRTIIPVSQQVTISPSKKGEEIALTQGKSVMLIVKETPKGIISFGEGIIMTNDGVIMAAQALPDGPLFAIGEEGSMTPLTVIGTDLLSSITFMKIPDQILPPVTLAQNAPNVGSELIALFRDDKTMHIAASRHTLSAIIAPDVSDALGIQQVALLTGSPLPPGTPLFTDEGRFSGVAREGLSQTTILVPDITAALSRLSNSTLSENPFKTLGFTVIWKLEKDIAGTFGIRAVVDTVTSKTSASDAGMKNGDILISSNGNIITWDSMLYPALAKRPLTFSLIRQNEERTIILP